MNINTYQKVVNPHLKKGPCKMISLEETKNKFAISFLLNLDDHFLECFSSSNFHREICDKDAFFYLGTKDFEERGSFVTIDLSRPTFRLQDLETSS
jgi:hypothetical protein